MGVVGETGDVLTIRARGGNASPRRKLASFIDECVAAIPKEARANYQLWLRVDSAGFSRSVAEAATRRSAAFSITCVQNKSIRKAIEALATNPKTVWTAALKADGELAGSEVAETTYRFAKRDLRLVVRRQRKATGEQLSFDDLGGWRFFAVITNTPGRAHRSSALSSTGTRLSPRRLVRRRAEAAAGTPDVRLSQTSSPSRIASQRAKPCPRPPATTADRISSGSTTPSGWSPIPGQSLRRAQEPGRATKAPDRANRRPGCNIRV